MNTIVLEINEPLPPSKKLLAETHDYWLDLIHSAVRELAQRQKLPYFSKAFVLIEITTPKYTDNTQLWDTSNRSINLVINNLKGIFFEDDNLEHMAFGVVGNWGETGKTVIKIMPIERFAELINNQ
jgi:predicted phosphohydrolase